MKYLLTLLFAIVFLSLTWGQDIIVLNAKSGKPVEGVIIFSEGLSEQTDLHGKANIDKFSDKTPIIFQHSSYLKLKTNKENIWANNNKVLLHEDPVRLDEIVISVSRREESKAEVPNKIVTISAEEASYQTPQTTADLLALKGGVFIQKSQMGGGSPMIRGFAANRVLLVVDGIRMNNAIYRSGNLHNVISLDVGSIEHTEVIFGPGSVIYGSDALGGVMSFSTLKPKLSTTESSNWSQQMFTRYSSANREKTIHGNLNFGTNKWAALVSVTYSDFDDLKMGSNGPDEYLRPEYVVYQPNWDGDETVSNPDPQVQRPSGYKQLNLLSKYRYRPSGEFEINLSIHHSSTSDIPRYDRLIVYKGGELKYGDWYYGPQKWTLFTAEAQYKTKTWLYDKLNILSGYQIYTESRNSRKINSPEISRRKENLSVASVNVDFDKIIGKNSFFYYGAEGYFNRVNSKGEGENIQDGAMWEIASRYPDGSTYSSMAGYFIYKFNYKQVFTLHTGLRYTQTAIKGTFSDKFYNFPINNFDCINSALNGNIGLVIHPASGWQLNINGSTGFRAPNIDDIAKVFDSEPGHVIVPNAGLKPEYAKNIEVGVIRSYHNKAKWEINVFYTQLDDIMVRRSFSVNGQDSIMYDGEMSKVEALVNAESAVIYGGSFSVEYLITRSLRTRHSVTILEGEDSDGLPLRHVPPGFGNSHLIFQNKLLYLDLYARYSGGIPYDKLVSDERNKPYIYAINADGNPYSPSWWTLNFKAALKLNRHFSVTGGIENILDKRYRPYSSGIVAPGINLIASLRMGF